MEITDSKLIREIMSYCSLNSIDVDAFVNKITKKGFTIERYGMAPVVAQDNSTKVRKRTVPIVYSIDDVSEPVEIEQVPVVDEHPKPVSRKKEEPVPIKDTDVKEKRKKRIIQAK